MDLKAELKRIRGVDVISEAGTEMSRFKDEDHFTSWMGLAPSKDISSGKVVGSGKKKVKNRVAIVLRTAATSLLESDTYLGAAIAICAGSYPHSKAQSKRWPAISQS